MSDSIDAVRAERAVLLETGRGLPVTPTESPN